MTSIIDYFAQIPTSHRSAILIGGIALFWMIESAVPLFRFEYKKWKHALLNIFFTLTTVVVNVLLAFILVYAADWATAQEIGLLPALPTMPLWLYALLGLMLLDLIGAYFAHWVEHKVTWMWQFHLIHHSDTHIDTTSANRHHPGESVIRFVFTTAAVLILGTPMWLVFMYQSFSVVFSQFNHANIALPRKLDTVLSWVIVSPDMHKVHHHYEQPWTDANYGNIFSIWDRLFGTFMRVDREEIVYGVDTHPDAREHNTLSGLLKMPFLPYRAPKGADKSKADTHSVS